MRAVVKAFPVLYACQGCPEFGQAAREVGALVEARGLAESVWLGKPGVTPKARFPIFALDGCAKGCALRWLAERGIKAQRAFVVADQSAERIAAELA